MQIDEGKDFIKKEATGHKTRDAGRWPPEVAEGVETRWEEHAFEMQVLVKVPDSLLS